MADQIEPESPSHLIQQGANSRRRRSSRYAPQWLGIDRDWWLTALLVTVTILVGLGTVQWYAPPKPAAAFMWAFACLGIGSLLGFIFAVPRAISVPERPTLGDGKSSEFYPRLAVNTNMEQISDWLTKLLVGVGLVQLRDLPRGLNAAAHYVAAGLGDDSKLVQFSAALLAFFTVQGFLAGYLATRIFFQRVFEKADSDLAETPGNRH